MNKQEKTEKIELIAQNRTVFGKSTKSLRKKGIIPANIFGKNFNPVSINVSYSDFIKTFKKAGETSVIYINCDSKNYPVLVSDINYHPVTEKIIHIDFRKVNLKEKIEAQVPIVFIGESELVKSKEGILLEQMNELTVLALPNEIPHQIEVDTSVLTEFGQTIKVLNLKKADQYEIKTDPDTIIASITEHKEEEIVPETTVSEPEIITEKAETETEPQPESQT